MLLVLGLDREEVADGRESEEDQGEQLGIDATGGSDSDQLNLDLNGRGESQAPLPGRYIGEPQAEEDSDGSDEGEEPSLARAGFPGRAASPVASDSSEELEQFDPDLPDNTQQKDARTAHEETADGDSEIDEDIEIEVSSALETIPERRSPLNLKWDSGGESEAADRFTSATANESEGNRFSDADDDEHGDVADDVGGEMSDDVRDYVDGDADDDVGSVSSRDGGSDGATAASDEESARRSSVEEFEDIEKMFHDQQAAEQTNAPKPGHFGERNQTGTVGQSASPDVDPASRRERADSDSDDLLDMIGGGSDSDSLTLSSLSSEDLEKLTQTGNDTVHDVSEQPEVPSWSGDNVNREAEADMFSKSTRASPPAPPAASAETTNEQWIAFVSMGSRLDVKPHSSRFDDLRRRAIELRLPDSDKQVGEQVRVLKSNP